MDDQITRIIHNLLPTIIQEIQKHFPNEYAEKKDSGEQSEVLNTSYVNINEISSSHWTRRMAMPGDDKAIMGDADFQNYHGKEFKRYKVGGNLGTDSFKNYSFGDNVVKDDFKGYGRDGNLRSEVFANYASETNVEDEGFTNYGSGSSAGDSHFSSYGSGTNVPDHHFKSYGTGRVEMCFDERDEEAKTRRLCRFNTEFNRQPGFPQRDLSLAGSRNSQLQRRSKALEDAAAESSTFKQGEMVNHDENMGYEGFDALPDRDCAAAEAILGSCQEMCPESEREERERTGDIDKFELLDGNGNQYDCSLLVKKYNRAVEREACLIRPFPVLQKTMDHLINLMNRVYDEDFLSMYNFLWDRMRAIRMDLRMQHILHQDTILMHEEMIRFHIVAMHELCESAKGEGFSEGFDAHLNIEQINKTSVELFQMYDDHRKRGILAPSEAEFRGYYALLKLDKHPGHMVEPAKLSLDLAKMTPEIRNRSEVLFARQVARASRSTNFIKFFRHARKATYLQSCLMHVHLAKLRTQALTSLYSSLQKNQGVPVSQVVKWLAMEGEDMEALLTYHGFSLKQYEEEDIVKEGPFLNRDNDFPTKRSQLVYNKRSSRVFDDVISSRHRRISDGTFYTVKATECATDGSINMHKATNTPDVATILPSEEKMPDYEDELQPPHCEVKEWKINQQFGSLLDKQMMPSLNEACEVPLLTKIPLDKEMSSVKEAWEVPRPTVTPLAKEMPSFREACEAPIPIVKPTFNVQTITHLFKAEMTNAISKSNLQQKEQPNNKRKKYFSPETGRQHKKRIGGVEEGLMAAENNYFMPNYDKKEKRMLLQKNVIRESIRAMFPVRECFTLVRPVNEEHDLQRLDQISIEKVRPEFRAGLDALTKFILEQTKPKQVGSTVMSGPLFAWLVQSYLDALNAGAVPTIFTSWQCVEERECRRAYELSIQEYKNAFDKSKPSEEWALREAHDSALQKALAVFKNIALGSTATRREYKSMLHDTFKKQFEEYKANAFKEADMKCSNGCEIISKKLRDACNMRGTTLDQVLEVLGHLVVEYENLAIGPTKTERLASFLYQSLEGPIRDLTHRLANQNESEKTDLHLKVHSSESQIELLRQQLKFNQENQNDYLKKYEDAVSERSSLADEYASRLASIQGQYTSLEDRYSKESSAWEKKYDQLVANQKIEEEHLSDELASLRTRCSSTEARLSAARDQIESAKSRRKHDLAIKEVEKKNSREYHSTRGANYTTSTGKRGFSQGRVLGHSSRKG